LVDSVDAFSGARPASQSEHARKQVLRRIWLIVPDCLLFAENDVRQANRFPAMKTEYPAMLERDCF
jgi:hypothetical protein